MFIKKWTNESIDKSIKGEINEWTKPIIKWRFLFGKII